MIAFLPGTESPDAKNGNLKAIFAKHHTLVSDVDEQLGTCVSALKDSMISVIRRKKEEDAKMKSVK